MAASSSSDGTVLTGPGFAGVSRAGSGSAPTKATIKNSVDVMAICLSSSRARLLGQHFVARLEATQDFHFAAESSSDRHLFLFRLAVAAAAIHAILIVAGIILE